MKHNNKRNRIEAEEKIRYLENWIREAFYELFKITYEVKGVKMNIKLQPGTNILPQKARLLPVPSQLYRSR